MKKYSDLTKELDGYIHQVFWPDVINFTPIGWLDSHVVSGKTIQDILDWLYQDDLVEEFISFWHQKIVDSYQCWVYHTALKIHDKWRIEQGKGTFNSFEKWAEKEREVFIIEKVEMFKELIKKIVLL